MCRHHISLKKNTVFVTFLQWDKGEEIDMKQIEQLPLFFKLKNHIIFV